MERGELTKLPVQLNSPGTLLDNRPSTLHHPNPQGSIVGFEHLLRDLTGGSAGAMLMVMSNTKDRVQTFPSKEPQKWELMLLEEERIVTEKVLEIMRTVFAQATQAIASLPADQQDHATSLFRKGIEVLTRALGALGAEIKKLLGHVADFIKGVWDALIQCCSAIAGVVSTLLP